MFDVGQKVVCIDDKFEAWHKKLYKVFPTEGCVYVIRDVRIGVLYSEGKRTGAISLLLVGLINPPADSVMALERGFNSDRFRPLSEMKDLAIRNVTIEHEDGALTKELEVFNPGWVST
jgi:hypothetical protein